MRKKTRSGAADPQPTSNTAMTKTILTITATIGILALSSCIGLAVKGADAGSERMEESDNTAISETGEVIQKGVKPISDATDAAVDAVKDAVD